MGEPLPLPITIGAYDSRESLIEYMPVLSVLKQVTEALNLQTWHLPVVDSPLDGECTTSGHPRWNSHSTHYGTDQFGFSAIPGGYREYWEFVFHDIGHAGNWWTSTEFEDRITNAWYRSMFNDSVSVPRYLTHIGRGLSVRCVRD